MSMTITYEEWLEKYQPIKNHLVEDSSYDGMMFETYGDELKFVQERIDKNLVWTLSDDGEGNLSIDNGYGYVNRMGYFVCKEPYAGSNFIHVNEGD